LFYSQIAVVRGRRGEGEGRERERESYEKNKKMNEF
jgi:hypothetical protein